VIRGRRGDGERRSRGAQLIRAESSLDRAAGSTISAAGTSISAAGITILPSKPRSLLSFATIVLKFAPIVLAVARSALQFPRIVLETAGIAQNPARRCLAISANGLAKAILELESARNELPTARSVQMPATTFLFSGAGVHFPAQMSIVVRRGRWLSRADLDAGLGRIEARHKR
jgi:hypothetical protein